MNNFKWILVAGASLVLVFIAAAVGFTLISNAHKKEVSELQNQIAARDTTIEVQKNVYARLSLKTDNVLAILDSSNKENAKLKEELRGKKADVLAAVSASIKWKQAYEAEVAGHQTEVITPEGIVRKRVDFQKDFGYLVAEGFTLTDPPEAVLKIKQGKPVRFNIVVAQEPPDVWKAYVTSSEENMAVDVTIAAVNPLILQPKWYEKIGVGVDIGVGNGVLFGAGVHYKIGKFTVGPKGWGAVNFTGPPTYYLGVGAGFNPFERN